MAAFVELKHITKVYKMGEVEIRAVDGIDFEIEKGELVVIVGPSGAGKTTVLNILGGMDTATSGKIIVDGADITRYNERQLTSYRRDDIGFVFQFYNLVPNLTAKENVELALQICKDPLEDLANGWTIFRRSYPEVNSSVFRLRGRWRRIRNCCCATNRPERWIIIPERRS